MEKNILVAPLNWGLGHATRCIPIIRALIENNFNPILASDGMALKMLKKEFPELQILELPSYQIEYAKEGKNFKWKMLKNSPKMMRAILEEKQIVNKWVSEYNLSGIISDNRLGVRSKKIPSVFITHQLNVLSGNTSWLTTKLHLNIIKKFTECWVPDFKDKPYLSGKLGHLKNTVLNLKYIGPISRFEKKELPIKYNLLVILSGPEPQRTMLEEKLIHEVSKFSGKVIFVKGIIENKQVIEQKDHITFINYMNTKELETTFNECEIVLCRSGYTTIMDLAKLGKKAFFIPTPGQFEQEYLATNLENNRLFPFSNQEDFRIGHLLITDMYTGVEIPEKSINWTKQFEVFNTINLL